MATYLFSASSFSTSRSCYSYSSFSAFSFWAIACIFASLSCSSFKASLAVLPLAMTFEKAYISSMEASSAFSCLRPVAAFSAIWSDSLDYWTIELPFCFCSSFSSSLPSDSDSSLWWWCLFLCFFLWWEWEWECIALSIWDIWASLNASTDFNPEDISWLLEERSRVMARRLRVFPLLIENCFIFSIIRK